MNTWMVRSRCATGETSWGDSSTTAPGGTRPTLSAVEKAEAWKPAKTKSRFPPLPTPPWKSRPHREIPTFPPRRLLFAWAKERLRRLAPPKPKTEKRTDHVLIKPDILTYYRHKRQTHIQYGQSGQDQRAFNSAC